MARKARNPEDKRRYRNVSSVSQVVVETSSGQSIGPVRPQGTVMLYPDQAIKLSAFREVTAEEVAAAEAAAAPPADNEGDSAQE